MMRIYITMEFLQRRYISGVEPMFLTEKCSNPVAQDSILAIVGSQLRNLRYGIITEKLDQKASVGKSWIMKFDKING